jgi:nucleotide-binding universal stress UspA family protein
MYTHILVPLDGTPRAERILPWLRPILLESRGVFRLLVVLRPGETVTDGKRVVAYAHQLDDAARADAAAYLRRLAAPLLADGIPVAVEVRFGYPVQTILATVAECGADLLALAAPWNGRWGAWGATGSVARLLRRAPVPVLMARRGGQRAA